MRLINGKMAVNLEQKVRTNRLLLIDKAIRSGKFPNANTLAELAEVNDAGSFTLGFGSRANSEGVEA